MQINEVTVSATVKVDDVLDEIDDEDIVEHLKRRGVLASIGEPSSVGYDYDELAHEVWHGDFDLDAFIRVLGVSDVRRALDKAL